jgi:hypothetical protein
VKCASVSRWACRKTKKTQKLAVYAAGCAHDSGKKRNVLIVSICLLIGVGFTLRSNTHRAVKVLGMREGPNRVFGGCHGPTRPRPLGGDGARDSLDREEETLLEQRGGDVAGTGDKFRPWGKKSDHECGGQ